MKETSAALVLFCCVCVFVFVCVCVRVCVCVCVSVSVFVQCMSRTHLSKAAQHTAKSEKHTAECSNLHIMSSLQLTADRITGLQDYRLSHQS